MTIQKPTHIMFVCTGNVFRSMSAEFALRSALPPHSNITVSSAGTRGRPEKALHPDVIDRLDQLGVTDHRTHIPRRLTEEFMKAADLTIAMNLDHQEFIRKNFNRETPNYMQIVTGKSQALLDLPDVIPDHRNHPKETRAFIYKTVDFIFENRDILLRNLERFLPNAPKNAYPSGGPAPRP